MTISVRDEEHTQKTNKETKKLGKISNKNKTKNEKKSLYLLKHRTADGD